MWATWVALVWACTGDAMTVDGKAQWVVDTRERGNGVFGIGARQIALKNASTCEGPLLTVRFGAGSPSDRLRLVGEASDAERSWLLQRAGAPEGPPAASLFLSPPPASVLVRETPAKVFLAEPTWHAGAPPEPTRTLTERPCDDGEAGTCWTLFRGDTLKATWTVPLSKGVTLSMYTNEARHQHRYMVVHDPTRDRHALVARDTVRNGNQEPVVVEGPGGVWVKEPVFMDPGWTLTRYSADGGVVSAFLGYDDDVHHTDDKGVWLVPIEPRGDVPQPRLLPWADLLP